jgi:four helix bundle protein
MTKEELQRRLQDFGVACAGLTRLQGLDYATLHLIRQLYRSGTSPALNYAEAIAGASTRDFINKLTICLKELHESKSNLVMLLEIGPAEYTSRFEDMLSESKELIAIFTTSVKTARRNQEGKEGC